MTFTPAPISVSRRTFTAGLGALLLTRPALAATPIDEQGFVSISGIDQWIAIQGSDIANPVILYLHGGPGEAQSPFLTDFQPWLQDFTVVNWDQRGAGKTYEKHGIATPGLTLDQLVADAVALSEHVLNTLRKKKLILVGQSAGSLLGLQVAQRRPDLFYAYAGTAQLVKFEAIAQWQEEQTHAKPTHDAAEVKTLHAWGLESPPDVPYIQRQMDFMHTPAGAAWLAGYEFESGKVGRDMAALDAATAVPRLDVPYFLIQGREDRLTPLVLAKAYFDKLQSNGKAFVAMDGGHFACFTHAGAFVSTLRRLTYPLI